MKDITLHVTTSNITADELRLHARDARHAYENTHPGQKAGDVLITYDGPGLGLLDALWPGKDSDWGIRASIIPDLVANPDAPAETHDITPGEATLPDGTAAYDAYDLHTPLGDGAEACALFAPITVEAIARRH